MGGTSTSERKHTDKRLRVGMGAADSTKKIHTNGQWSLSRFDNVNAIGEQTDQRQGYRPSPPPSRHVPPYQPLKTHNKNSKQLKPHHQQRQRQPTSTTAKEEEKRNDYNTSETDLVVPIRNPEREKCPSVFLILLQETP